MHIYSLHYTRSHVQLGSWYLAVSTLSWGEVSYVFTLIQGMWKKTETTTVRYKRNKK